MKRTTSTTLFSLIAIVLLALTGCGVLRNTDNAGEDALTEVIAASEAQTVLISDTADQQAELEGEIDTLEQQLAQLTEVINQQQAKLDGTVAQVENSAETITELSNQPIVVQQNEVPVVQTSNPVSLDLQDSLTNLYDRANPSVVFIQVGTQQGLGGSGSGFVYDLDGHIVTNNHVVADAANLDVVYSDGTRSRAVVVGTDVDSDLAVIRAERLPEGVLPIPLSSMDNVDVGQFAVAIGNPFGEQGSMSLGIISGLGRSLSSQRAIDGSGGSYRLPQVIQTDAPINPGNSGGPLLNLNGEVIGVNSAIRTLTGENSGVGFSVPVDAVRLMVPELIENGEYTYPFLGLRFASEEFKVRYLEEIGVETTFGAYVGGVSPSGPAASADIQGGDATGFGGDLITALNGELIKDFDDLNAFLVFNTKPGDTIDVTVLRDGEELVVPVTLGERP